MEKTQALDVFAALGQGTRLDVFRLLVKAGPDGLNAGQISETLGVRPNTLSANLAILLNSRLVRNKRDGRLIRYYAEMGTMQALVGFLLEDCCGGAPEKCRPLLDEIAIAG
jgi:DNA-binding transcriptional ArsR family regulator